ncbi:MAG: radical SAM protein [Candidatus Aenigmatarchaeota archaeon]
MVKVEVLPYSSWKTKNGYVIFSHLTGGWVHISNDIYRKFTNNEWNENLIRKFFWRGIIKLDGQLRPVSVKRYDFNPTLIEIELTKKCTLRCKYCYADAGKGKSMKKETLERIAELIAKLPNKRIGIQPSGGEPLLEWKKIEWLINKIRELKKDLAELKVNIETNGTILTPKIAKKLKEYDIKVGISIDGREFEHNSARIYENGRGSYDNVIKAIENLRNAGFNWISSITTFHKFNMKEPEGILRHLWLDLNISASRFNYIILMGRAKQNASLLISPEEFLTIKKRIFLEAYKLKRKGCKSKLLDEYFDNLTRMYDKNICLSRGCAAGLRMYFVDINGNLYPCTRLQIPTFKLGNVTELNSFQEAYKNFIKFPLRAASTIKECTSCPWQFFCNGGCPGECLHFYNDTFKPSPFCKFIKGYYKFLLNFIINNYKDPWTKEITF